MLHLLVNSAWLKLCRVEEDNLHGWYDNIDSRDRPRVLAEWLKCLEARTPFNCQYRWYDGTVALVQAVPNATNIDLATGWIGELTCSVKWYEADTGLPPGSVTDVTAQYNIEQEVRALSEERKASATKAAADTVIALEQKRQQGESRLADDSGLRKKLIQFLPSQSCWWMSSHTRFDRLYQVSYRYIPFWFASGQAL